MTFIVTIRVLATVLPAVGITLTLLRLYYRWRRRHLGWDDAWAAVAMLCGFFLCAGAWTRSDNPSTGPFHHSKRVQAIGYYMLNTAFTSIIWASRLSILFSIIRIVPHLMTLRLWARLSGVLFGLMWLELVIHKIVVCETHNEWKAKTGTQCVLGPAVAGVELATDFLADVILTVLPIRLLWDVQLSTKRRALIIGLFSASMLTTVVSIIHAVYVVGHNRNAEGIAAHVQASTSLMVCNLVVLVTWFLRAIRKESGGSSSEGPSVGPTRGHSAQAPKDMTTLQFRHDDPIILNNMGTDSKYDEDRDSTNDLVFAPTTKEPVANHHTHTHRDSTNGIAV